MSSQTKNLKFLITFFSCMLSLTGFAVTIADSVILYTPYTRITVSPGQSVDYSVLGYLGYRKLMFGAFALHWGNK